MTTTYYPNISEEQILLINRVQRTLGENPKYLDDAPYSQVIKDFFKKSAAAATQTQDLFEGDEIEAVARQVQKLINDLEAFATQLTSADHSEKLQYFKTKTTLVEKLIVQLERTANLKQINEFRSIVIQFMDEVLTKDQVTDFMKRIDGVLTNGR